MNLNQSREEKPVRDTTSSNDATEFVIDEQDQIPVPDTEREETQNIGNSENGEIRIEDESELINEEEEILDEDVKQGDLE